LLGVLVDDCAGLVGGATRQGVGHGACFASRSSEASLHRRTDASQTALG
jgi:hypothetical protein